ncbi:SLAM family member 5-like [Leuresthes tenuis]|uniref:SLAM family member 5-like n=1 Tax=Leuresthes tenuis TaxID=355514 RepID=UPI003B515445
MVAITVSTAASLCTRFCSWCGSPSTMWRPPPESVSFIKKLVTTATWKYGSTKVADLGRGVIQQKLFQSRLEFNPTNFSLTLRDLTVGDSGDFSFISEANDQQRPSVTIALQVHEPITEDPVIDSKTTYQALNESCAVVLKCSSATHSNATYNWVVGSHTYSGSGLQRTIRPQDGGTTFTCTASNFVSEKSASKTVTCSSKDTGKGSGSSLVVPIVRLFIGFLIILLLVVFLHHTKSKGEMFCCSRCNFFPETAEKDQNQQAPLFHKGAPCFSRTDS